MTVDNSEQGSSTVTRALDSVRGYLFKAEHRRTEEDERNVQAAMHHIRSFMMKASSEQSELLLALADAWVYVQRRCTIKTVMNRVGNLVGGPVRLPLLDVARSMDVLDLCVFKPEHRSTSEDEQSWQSAIELIGTTLKHIDSDSVALVLALRDAWPYVHAGCESDSMKERISAVMRKHGNGDSWAAAGNDEPGVHSSHGSAPERLVHDRPRPGAAP